MPMGLCPRTRGEEDAAACERLINSDSSPRNSLARPPPPGTLTPPLPSFPGGVMRIFSASLLVLAAAVSTASADGYKLVKTIPVPGDGGWDYCTVDGAGRRVYVSH